MKRLVLIGVLLLTLGLALNLVYAQDGLDDTGNPNDPASNDRANACFEGGALAGKCDSSDLDFDGVVEEWEQARMWECGWHYINWQYGLISESNFADQCEWILPPEPTEEPTPEPTPEVTPPVVEIPL
jgi:hypothetical protein